MPITARSFLVYFEYFFTLEMWELFIENESLVPLIFIPINFHL